MAICIWGTKLAQLQNHGETGSCNAGHSGFCRNQFCVIQNSEAMVMRSGSEGTSTFSSQYPHLTRTHAFRDCKAKGPKCAGAGKPCNSTTAFADISVLVLPIPAEHSWSFLHPMHAVCAFFFGFPEMENLRIFRTRLFTPEREVTGEIPLC